MWRIYKIEAIYKTEEEFYPVQHESDRSTAGSSNVHGLANQLHRLKELLPGWLADQLSVVNTLGQSIENLSVRQHAQAIQNALDTQYSTVCYYSTNNTINNNAIFQCYWIMIKKTIKYHSWRGKGKVARRQHCKQSSVMGIRPATHLPYTPSVWTTSWRWGSTGAFKTRHRSTWSTTASQSLMSPVDSIWDLPVVTSWLFRGFDEVHSAVGPSLLGVWRLGTHYRTVSVIHRSAAAALGVVWRLYFSRNTSVLSAIEMLHDIALYKFNIHIHIHCHYHPSGEVSTKLCCLATEEKAYKLLAQGCYLIVDWPAAIVTARPTRSSIQQKMPFNTHLSLLEYNHTVF